MGNIQFALKQVEPRENSLAIVTGSNQGIGFHVARGLLRVGYSVVLACRSREKAEQAMEQLQLEFSEDRLIFMELDLTNFESVRNFAKQFCSRFTNLNLLINNAGIMDTVGTKTSTGLEIQFATNHLGHFLLTSLLLPFIVNDSRCRVVSLGSVAHKRAEIHFEDITCFDSGGASQAYAQSKLACLMFSDELNRRLKENGMNMLSICAHPGGSASSLFKDTGFWDKLIFQLVGPFLTHSNQAAAESVLCAALSDEMEGGEYIGPQGIMDLKGPPGYAKRTDYSGREDLAKKLWDLSLQLCGAKFEI